MNREPLPPVCTRERLQTMLAAPTPEENDMKVFKTSLVAVFAVAILFIAHPGLAQDGFTQKDRELLIRLTVKMEEMDKRFEQVNKRFEQVDKRFGELRADMNARFDQLINMMIAIISAFSGIVVVTIGFAIWDRRTMIRPFETKVRNIEVRLEEVSGQAKIFDEEKLNRLIGAMKKIAGGNKEIAEALRSFNLL